jgi:hypothetical protein
MIGNAVAILRTFNFTAYILLEFPAPLSLAM